MKERRGAGRFGDSSIEVQNERELRRKERWARATPEEQLAALEAHAGAWQPELTKLLPSMEALKLKSRLPGKITRVELEAALVDQKLLRMSPGAALAYASWILSSERGWSGAATTSAPAGELASLFTNPQGNTNLSEASLAEAQVRIDETLTWAEGHAAGHALEERARSASGAPLPAELAGKLAPFLGPHGKEAARAARLHTDDTADQLASAHQAHAITIGDQIFFGRGAYAPGTEAGDDLLVHELTHVAQGQRGELTRAAAKLTSGTNLAPGEAEAELRAKLAVIELHAPPATAPAVAAPAGQPTSDGERQQRLAAQQQRITLAEDDAIPEADSKPPAPSNPLAAVDHPLPEMTRPAKGGGKDNAYVATFDEAPSKQAMGAWDAAGAVATTQFAAEQAAFDAGLPPMPVVLDGGEGKPAKAGAGATQAKAKAPPAGAVPPAAVPTTPTADAPTVTAAKATAANASQNLEALEKAQVEAKVKQILAALPFTAPDIETDPGTPPMTDLAGQADPVRATAEQQTAYADGAKALDAEKKKILAGPGAAQLQPKQLDEKLKVPKAQAPGEMPELPKIEGMDKFKKWSLPADVQTSFDGIAKPKMEANLAQAKAKMTEAEAVRDADRDKAVTDSQEKVKAAHADADAKQQAKVAEGRTKIVNKQAETLGKQEAEIKKLDKESDTKKKATLGKVNDRIAKDQAKVETDYADAQKKAEAEKKKGEEDAKKKKEEAERKANEDRSIWDRATDALCDLVDEIAEQIDKALEAIGELIGDILDAVKEAACSLIDAARDFVCAVLEEFAEWVKSGITALLGSVFPELAEALNNLVDDVVEVTTAAVNAVADGLKTAVTAACDGLKAAVDAVISTCRAAVKAAAALAKALITGDWSEVARMALEAALNILGIDPAAFYALVGKVEDTITKIIDDPGAFVGHLVDAVKLGFQQFGDNFLTHLKDGVLQWLFGTFAEAGIDIPATFDIAGVFDLTCQVLGLTWGRLRGKVVKVIGEENTERLEFVSQYIEALVTGGFAGLWEKVQQDLGMLWDTVIGGAKQWLMETLVQQAILKIATMWNPAGALINLIKTAWDVYCWVKDNAQRIVGLVQAVVDSISNIANGNISGAANYIESSLAKLVPIAISLFANLLGLGGIADKIKDIITKVQTKVDQAIDNLIERVMALFKGKDKKKDGEGKDGEGDDEIVRVEVSFSMSGEGHKLTGTLDKGNLTLIMASVPRPFGDKLTAARRTQDDLANALPAGPEKTKHEQARDALDAIEPWFESEKTRITADPDKAKRTSGMNQLMNDLKERVVAVGNAHGLTDFVYESFGIDRLLESINTQVDKELRKHFGKPGMLGDGHNNTATAAEALGVVSKNGVPLHYTELHETRTRTCLSVLEEVIRKMDALDTSHPSLHLSSLPDYQKAKDEISGCNLALSDPTAYLAAKGFRVVAGDFQ